MTLDDPDLNQKLLALPEDQRRALFEFLGAGSMSGIEASQLEQRLEMAAALSNRPKNPSGN